MFEDLSAKQLQIFEFLKSELNTKGYPPSVREICDAVNLRSTSTVHAHLAKLEKKGYIRRDPTKPRAIEILDFGFEEDLQKEIINIPIVGRVAAGHPILAEENVEDYFPIAKEFIGDADCFILKVYGDSMINIGILDGDYVIVRKQNSAFNGDIVVALVDGEEATVKRFYKKKDHFRLQPENDFMEPIIVSDVSILGVVIATYRSYL